jgi:hypothetical protein
MPAKAGIHAAGAFFPSPKCKNAPIILRCPAKPGLEGGSRKRRFDLEACKMEARWILLQGFAGAKRLRMMAERD